MLPSRFMTVREVAELLQVGEATMRDWIHQRALRAFDLGREWRISPDDLEELLARQAQRAAGQ